MEASRHPKRESVLLLLLLLLLFQPFPGPFTPFTGVAAAAIANGRVRYGKEEEGGGGVDRDVGGTRVQPPCEGIDELRPASGTVRYGIGPSRETSIQYEDRTGPTPATFTYTVRRLRNRLRSTLLSNHLLHHRPSRFGLGRYVPPSLPRSLRFP